LKEIFLELPLPAGGILRVYADWSFSYCEHLVG